MRIPALNAAIEAARDKPFKWGEHDCCIFAANVVRDMTGADFAAGYRGQYHDARSALEIVAKNAGLEAIATQALGEPIPASKAKRGDVVLVDTEGRHALGICIGERVAAPGRDGLVFPLMDQWIKAWTV